MKIKKYTRVTAFFLAVCTVLLMLPLSVRADEYWPDGVKTQSKSAIVMEVNTGTVLYEKKSHEKHYPASITKIMTVLLAIENCDMDEVVTFSADAVFKNEGDTSHIARNLGEKLTMEQCLYAVMLESANECAYAVAEHVGQKLGGDYRTFIDLMNKRAKELGCTDTHFNNCNGLPDEDHWVSAYDMALISAEAYKNETFRMIAGSPSYTLPKTNKCKAEYPCHNHHKMIYPFRGDSSHLYQYCTGGKTGYTTVANNTLVSFAEKDGITLVCVVMDAATPDHYTDTRKLFDYCFENFQALNISENDAVLAKDNGKDYGVLNNSEPYVKLDEDAADFLADTANGDARAALNAIELGVLTTGRSEDGLIHIDLAAAQECIQKRAVRYDKDGDNHYDTVSAFIKSMRGSDPDAAVYYLARMLYAGEDIKFIARRIMICASEDVGNADPQALSVAVSASLAAERIGLPEAQIILSQAASYVACAPKSNASYMAIQNAMENVKTTRTMPVPVHLQDRHYKGAAKLGHGEGYKYAHDYPKHYVNQQYLPDGMEGTIFYEPSDNGYEKQIKEHMKWLKE